VSSDDASAQGEYRTHELSILCFVSESVTGLIGCSMNMSVRNEKVSEEHRSGMCRLGIGGRIRAEGWHWETFHTCYDGGRRKT